MQCNYFLVFSRSKAKYPINDIKSANKLDNGILKINLQTRKLVEPARIDDIAAFLLNLFLYKQNKIGTKRAQTDNS